MSGQPWHDLVKRHAALVFSPQPTDPLARRDPDFIKSEQPYIQGFVEHWFDPDLLGFEHIPNQGPVLIVGVHNGGVMAPDMFAMMVAFWRRFGANRPAYGLAHDQVFHVPIVGRWIAKLGGVPARFDYALELLARGATVLVFPGGDLDAFKPFSERHQIHFGGRKGFIRLALSARVPILPVVTVGAHETFFVITDGRKLPGHRLLKRVARVEVLPIIACLPWGLWVGPWEAHLPLPSKLRIAVLPPIHLTGRCDDEALVQRHYEAIEATMQRGLDALVRQGGFGVRARFSGIGAYEGPWNSA